MEISAVEDSTRGSYTSSLHQRSKTSDATEKRREEKNDRIRYLTLKIRQLDKGGIMSGAPNPVLVVYDSLLQKLVGSTEWLPHKTNVDFEEVIVIQWYPKRQQQLSFKVYDVQDKKMKDSDLIGQADIDMDLLAESEGREVKLQLFNAANTKRDLKLKSNRTVLIVHTIPRQATVDILQSGFLLLTERANSKKKQSVKPGKQRFLVLKERELWVQDTVKNYFLPSSSVEAHDPKVKAPHYFIDLKGCAIKESEHAAGGAWYLQTPHSKFYLATCENSSHQGLTPTKKAGRLRRSSQVGFSLTPSASSQQQGLLGKWLESFKLALPSQVFGVPLALAARRSDPRRMVPGPVRLACDWLNKHALDEEGLYRIPGSQSDVKGLSETFNRGETPEIPEHYCGSNLASVNVQFLRQLPENLFTDTLARSFEELATQERDDFTVGKMTALLARLPVVNYHTVMYLVKHLRTISENSEVNEMISGKLAMCVYTKMATTIHFLIDHPSVFEQEPPTHPIETPEATLSEGKSADVLGKEGDFNDGDGYHENEIVGSNVANKEQVQSTSKKKVWGANLISAKYRATNSADSYSTLRLAGRNCEFGVVNVGPEAMVQPHGVEVEDYDEY